MASPHRGPKLEQLSRLAAYTRVTARLAESVGRLCAVMAIRHVAHCFALNWKTVKALDRQHLERTLGPVDLDGIEVIALDEFAIRKGHRYAIVIVEPTRKRVLWVGREVIDRVRVDRANQLRGDRRGRRVVKGARWLLLKNRDSLRAGENVHLEALLAAKHDLFVVYVPRDALKDLWR